MNAGVDYDRRLAPLVNAARRLSDAKLATWVARSYLPVQIAAQIVTAERDADRAGL